MANRSKRRRRERMILASVVKPFEINGSAAVAIEAGAPDATGPAPIRIDAYGGGIMTVTGIGPCVVDISGIEASGRIVVLDGHTNTLSATLGSATVQAVEGRSLIAVGTISRTNEAAAKAIELSRDNVPLQASIGAEPLDPPVRVRAGESVAVNGRNITAGPGGFLLFRRARLRHIAILPNGADATTSVSIAAAAANNQEGANVDFQKWCESLGFVVADLSAEQVTLLQSVYDKLQAADAAEDAAETGTEMEAKAPEKVAAEAVAAIRAELAAESARVSAIRTVCGKGHAEIEAKAIAEGWDSTKAELEVLRASRPRLPAIHSKESGPVNFQSIEAAMCMKAGVPVEKAGYSEQTLDAAHKMRNRRIDWFAEQICAKKGIELDGPVGSKGWIEAAFSTSELSGIVGNVANKALQNAFQAYPSIAETICGIAQHSNFHKHTVYSLALGGELREVSKDGELKHLRLAEESYERQVKTRGALLRISEEDMINDDMGAFNRNAQAIANKALVSREKAVFTALCGTGNGASFFTSARGNYFEGSGTALAHASLATATQMFMDQTDPSGDPTLLTPKYLVVPTALSETAKTLLQSDYLLGPTTTKQPSNNIWKNAYEQLSSPFLSNANISGSSSTAWFLLADPTVMPAIELAYLNGQSTPRVEFFGIDSDPETLGVTWRVTYRFGVALAEYRAGVKSKGAA